MTATESNNIGGQFSKPRKILEFDGLDEDWPDLSDIPENSNSMENESSIVNENSIVNLNGTGTFKGDPSNLGGYGTIRIQQKPGKTLSKAKSAALNSLRLKDGVSSVHIQPSDSDSNASQGTMKAKKDKPWVNRQYNDMFTPLTLESLFSQPPPVTSATDIKDQSSINDNKEDDELKNPLDKKLIAPVARAPKPGKYPFKDPKLSSSKPVEPQSVSPLLKPKIVKNPTPMKNQPNYSSKNSHSSDSKGSNQPKAHQLFQSKYDTTTRNWLDNMVAGLDNISSKANSINSTSPPMHPSIQNAQQQNNNRLKKIASAPSLRVQKPLNFKNRNQAHKWDFQNEIMPNNGNQNQNQRKFTPYLMPSSPSRDRIQESSMEYKGMMSIDQGFTQEWLKNVTDQKLNFEGDASPVNLLDEISSSTSQISVPNYHNQPEETQDTTILTAGVSSFNHISPQNPPYNMDRKPSPQPPPSFGDISIQGQDLSFSEDSNRNYKESGSNNLLDKTSLSELSDQIQKGMVLNGTSTVNENSFSSSNSTVTKPRHSRNSSESSKHPPVSGKKWADLSVGPRMDGGSTTNSNHTSRPVSPKNHSSDMSSGGPSNFQSNPTLLPITPPTWNWVELLGKDSPVNSNKPKLGADKAADHLKKQGVIPSRPHPNDLYLITPDLVGELPDLIGNMKFDMTSRCWIPLSPIGEDPFSGMDDDHQPPNDEAPSTIESPETPEQIPEPQLNANRTLTPKTGRDQLHPKRNTSKPFSYYRVKPIKSLNSMPPFQPDDQANSSKSFKRNSLRRSSYDSGSQGAFLPITRPHHNMQFQDTLSNNKMNMHLPHSNYNSQANSNQGASMHLNPITYQGVPGWFLSSMEFPMTYSFGMGNIQSSPKSAQMKDQGTQTEDLSSSYLPLSRNRNTKASITKLQTNEQQVKTTTQKTDQYSYFTGNKPVVNEIRTSPPIQNTQNPNSSVVIRENANEEEEVEVEINQDVVVTSPTSPIIDDRKYSLKLTTENLPIDTTKLINIQHLDLSSLGLAELPFIQDLSQLRSVILDNNNLATLDWFKNNSIQSLSLKNNKITQFPLNYQLSELVKLNLEGNLLEVLDGLQNLTSLKYLNLSSISSLKLTKLSSQQCYHKSLKILKLKAHNQGQVISFSPRWFPKLVELYLDGFELNKNCSELEFSEKLKKISMRKSYGNCEMVLKESKLRELGYLFAEGNRLIYDNLQNLHLINLVYLELSDLKLTALNLNLSKITPQLKGIDLSNNSLTNILQVLQNCPKTLQFVNVNNNQLTEDSILELIRSELELELIRFEFKGNCIKVDLQLLEYSLKYKFGDLKFINSKKV